MTLRARRIALAVSIALHAWALAVLPGLPGRVPTRAADDSVKGRSRGVMAVTFGIAPAAHQAVAQPAHKAAAPAPAAKPDPSPAPPSAKPGRRHAAVSPERAATPASRPVPTSAVTPRKPAPDALARRLDTAAAGSPTVAPRAWAPELAAAAEVPASGPSPTTTEPAESDRNEAGAPAAEFAPPAAVVPALTGAAFAGLFTPITSRPLGHSGWGGRRAASRPAPDPQAQREQVLASLRMSLLGRLNDLSERLRANGHAVHCRIAVDAPRHVADVHCTETADQGAPWSALQGLLVAGPVAADSASLCFSVVGVRVAAEVCGADGAAMTKGEATLAASP